MKNANKQTGKYIYIHTYIIQAGRQVGGGRVGGQAGGRVSRQASRQTNRQTEFINLAMHCIVIAR